MSETKAAEATTAAGEATPTRKSGPMQRMLKLNTRLSLSWGQIALAVMLAGLYAVFEGFGVAMLTPVLTYIEDPASVSSASGEFGALLDFVNSLGLPINLGVLLAIAFVPVVLRQFVYFANAWYTANIQRRLSLSLRTDGFGAIVKADLGFIVDEGQGNLVSALTAQVQRGVAAIFYSVSLISIGLLLAVYVVVLVILSPQLAAIAVVAMLGLSLLVKRSIARSRQHGAEASALSNDMYSVFGERVAAVRLIKMRAQEDAEQKRVDKVVRAFEQTQLNIAIARAGIEITVDPLLMVALFVIVFVGVEFFGITLASLGVFLFVLLRLNQKTKEFNLNRQLLSSNIDSLNYVYQVLDRARSARKIAEGTREFDGLQEAIVFSDVTFRYPGADERMVLDRVSLRIERGSMAALVGRSGSGKSTLVDLIPRLREPTSGVLRFDGTPVSDFRLRSLRRGIGFMTQEAVLFNDTIRGNLLFGLEREPSEDEIRHALEDSYCLEFVEQLPKGLETNVGDRGVRLSGGQRQRLALARVMLEDPDILILDEPTSALDSESEQYIQEALERIRGRKTLIVIAHRLSTVQRADRIFVLDSGRLVEQGVHDELLRLDGPYRKLFDLQLQA